MTFAEGDAVEVKVGSGLGRWVTARWISQLGEVVEVTIMDRVHLATPAQVRSPRRSSTPTVATRPKRTTRKRVDNTGRGPLRYPNYRAWVKTKPCIFCGHKAQDPHHVGSKGYGQQTDDTKVVAVCRKAHDALHHRRPDELCEPMAYLREDPEHAWAVVEAHLGRFQAEHITEFLRFHGGVMS